VALFTGNPTDLITVLTEDPTAPLTVDAVRRKRPASGLSGTVDARTRTVAPAGVRANPDHHEPAVGGTIFRESPEKASRPFAFPVPSNEPGAQVAGGWLGPNDPDRPETPSIRPSGFGKNR
jgi:hypothetical protein